MPLRVGVSRQKQINEMCIRDRASTACPACGLIPNSTASGALKLIIFQFAFVHVELNTTEWTLEDGPMGDGVYTLIKVGSGTLEPHPHSPPT